MVDPVLHPVAIPHVYVLKDTLVSDVSWILALTILAQTGLRVIYTVVMPDAFVLLVIVYSGLNVLIKTSVSHTT